jgi:hypothetical protein
MWAERQTESIADITGNDVQMAMKYVLPRRLAVCKLDVYAFTSDAALTQSRGNSPRDTKHARAFSCRHHFFTNEMKSNYRRLLPFFKMATHRVTNLLSQTRQVISLGENCLA